MDQSSSLGHQSEVAMPAFERLSHEAVYAEEAHSPAGETRLSLPSYLIGEYVSETDRRRDGDLDLLVRDHASSLLWSQAPSVFTRSKALGLKTALAGWYLPYCRVIGDQLDYCSSEVYESVVPAVKTSIFDRVERQFSTVDPLNGREQHILRHRHILAGPDGGAETGRSGHRGEGRRSRGARRQVLVRGRRPRARPTGGRGELPWPG